MFTGWEKELLQREGGRYKKEGIRTMRTEDWGPEHRWRD